MIAQKDKVASLVEEKSSGKAKSGFKNISTGEFWAMVDDMNCPPRSDPIEPCLDVNVAQEFAYGVALGNQINQDKVGWHYRMRHVLVDERMR
ncbi:MAG TPA: hypothetical protein VMM76_06435 [Pirellulaceae bacterium]|nr:hypothetical protein [Pirellulaceae bacterium]